MLITRTVLLHIHMPVKDISIYHYFILKLSRVSAFPAIRRSPRRSVRRSVKFQNNFFALRYHHAYTFVYISNETHFEDVQARHRLVCIAFCLADKFQIVKRNVLQREKSVRGFAASKSIQKFRNCSSCRALRRLSRQTLRHFRKRFDVKRGNLWDAQGAEPMRQP